jgi:tRNA uridine 5-carboxymethylaminomethyl modification enzyme
MFIYPNEFDVVVVGAGHAGVEAGLAAARMGRHVLMLTTNADTIGQMSCNPAIGGLAKGHIAREIDALGGEMGKTTDMTGLQFRMLNKRRGPAVWSPRAQCDKKAYQFRLKWICEREPNLEVKQGQVVKILHKDGVALGVETTLGVQFLGKTVIVTTGTFLHGLMHVGQDRQSGGRSGEAASTGLSESLKEIGLHLGRLKTGTPPRLLHKTIEFSKTETQSGDDPMPHFSYWRDELFHVEQASNGEEPPGHPLVGAPPSSVIDNFGGQMPCHLTFTTEKTARIVRENINLSPMYSGKIEGIGPRYCPSIEDKIIKFSEKERHQIFLEPEGIATDEIYINGLSTCLPFEIQIALVRSVIGCESAEIIRPAYAVEYDFVFPTQLLPSLETKPCKNLFLAGQINGTSGYEEAGAQGIIAGINAALQTVGKSPIILRRDQAYIGVLIDDLVTKGTGEPYRMFTSRAEYRLLLRQDNADLRLSGIGHAVGLLPERNYSKLREKSRLIDGEISRLNQSRHGAETLAQLLRRPEVNYHNLPGSSQNLASEITDQVEIAIKYDGYINRQNIEVNNITSLDKKQIPTTFDFSTVPSLRLEARQKLAQIRPATLGQASRISGVSPADISILNVWMKRQAAQCLPPPTALNSNCSADFETQ